MDIKLYLKAAAALAVMGTVSFFVFDGLLGRQTDRREPVAAQALVEGGPDYVHGRDAIAAIDTPVTLTRSPVRASPFATSYRITEDVAGRVYKNGVDEDGEIRQAQVAGVWKAPSFVRASRQLPPDTWQPQPIAQPADSARCPAGMTDAPFVGALRFLVGARPPAALPGPLRSGDTLSGCIEIGRVLPLSIPAPLVTTATVKGMVTHRGRPAMLFVIAGQGPAVESFSGYALADRDTGFVVFSDVEAKFRDPAAHGGYTASVRELARVDLR
ncbi:MAG TPA: hypothetical protein VLL76_06155 [Candidatus Omnitrophota bacterium]|nr:hypothetical protein [Candidatus Omnitrophota bacterium]